MNPSVRVVCGSCLRSLEFSGSSEERGMSLCPHCGSYIPIDSSQFDATSEPEPGDQEFRDADQLARGCATVQRIGSTSAEWVTNWARGSIGSLGRFQLRERLGDGGFGEVYRAFDPRLDRDVAIKILKLLEPDERVMERFFREARAAARLDHPNIVAVHDSGFDGGRCWVAYQLVTGRPLWWYRDHHRMDAATVARVIRALADALDHSHHMGVLHRDIKPANVLIDDQGSPRLIDFGLARRSDFESDLTREGAIVGTPAYMSPEQALGHSRLVDERSDVYSLGVIFYELLYGRRPDESGSSAPAKPRRAVRTDTVPAGLRRICATAIAVDPAARHSSARNLADELDEWLLTSQHRAIRAGRLSRHRSALQSYLAWSESRGRFWPGGQQSAEPDQAPVSRLRGLAAEADRKGWLVGSYNSKVYHRPDCVHVKLMAEHNQRTFKSAAEAAGDGRVPCELFESGRGKSAATESRKLVRSSRLLLA